MRAARAAAGSHGGRRRRKAAEDEVKGGVLSASPAVIHFAGFTLNKLHKQTVSIGNGSKSSIRLRVHGPNTSAFKLRIARKGSITPGGAQELTICFLPTAFRYYHDTLRVYCEGDTILLHVHAYPVANIVDFPRSLDLGACALSETVRRRIPLSCSVPIAFEFRCSIVRSHPDFQLEPMSGVIPARGRVDLIVSFTPVKLASCFFEFELLVAQFNAKPIRCVVSGRSAPGITRERMLRAMVEEDELLRHLERPETARAAATAALAAAAEVEADVRSGGRGDGGGEGSGGGGGGSGGSGVEGPSSVAPEHVRLELESSARHSPRPTSEEDVKAVTRTLRARALRPVTRSIDSYGPVVAASRSVKDRDAAALLATMQASRKAKLRAAATKKRAGGSASGRSATLSAAELAKRRRSSADEIDGLRIPRDLKGVAALNFVLTQQPGKLKPKDLKLAIDEQRRRREEQKRDQERMRARRRNAGGVLEALLEEAEDAEGGELGSRQLQELVFLQTFQEAEAAEKNLEFQSGRERVGDSVLTKEQVDVVVAKRAELAERSREQELAARRCSFDTVVPPLRVAVSIGCHPPVRPQFDPYKGDVFRMRKLIRDRFINAATTIIVRRRAEQRLEKIRVRLAAARTRAEVKRLVEADNRQQGIGSSLSRLSLSRLSTTKDDITNRVCTAIVHPIAPPLFERSHAKLRSPVEVETARSFSDLARFSLRSPEESASMGYKPYAIPPAPCHVPVAADRQLRTGAEEESGLQLQLRVSADVVARQEAVAAADVAEAAAAAAASAAAVAAGKSVEDAEEAAAGASEADSSAEEAALARKLALVASLAVPRLAQLPPSMPLLQYLKPPASVRTFAPLLPLPETDPAHILRAQPRIRRLPLTRLTQDALGLCCLRALASTPSISDYWQPHHRQRLPVGFKPAMPALLTGPLPEDSDSDSDDDDDDDDYVRPTFAAARALFESDDAEAAAAAPSSAAAGKSGRAGRSRGSARSASRIESVSEVEEEKGGSDGDGDDAVESGMAEVMRDRQWLALEARKRKRRRADEERLVLRMADVSALIAHPRHRFDWGVES